MSIQGEAQPNPNIATKHPEMLGFAFRSPQPTPLPVNACRDGHSHTPQRIRHRVDAMAAARSDFDFFEKPFRHSPLPLKCPSRTDDGACHDMRQRPHSPSSGSVASAERRVR